MKRLPHWQKTVFPGIGLGICSSLCLAFAASGQEVVGDTTLSPATQVEHDVGNRIFLIQGGVSAGANLFHSFEEFSIPPDHTAIFVDSAQFETVFSRVTGASESLINGTIALEGNADFFLLNPNGIVFGPGAFLNMNGSFIASTASDIEFANGRFGVSDEQTPPNLLVGVPLGLQFGASAEDIRVESLQFGLINGTGNTLALIGGDVFVQNSLLLVADTNPQTRTLELAGRLALVSADANRTVDLSQLDGEWVVAFFPITDASKVQILDNSSVGSEDTQILGGQVEIAQFSTVLTTDLTILAAGAVTLENEGSLETGSDSASNINIQANQLTLRGGQIRANTFREGEPGSNILLNVWESITLAESSDITNATSDGDAGQILVDTGNLILQGDSQISSSTSGDGQAGQLIVEVDDSILIEGQDSGLLSVTTGEGDAGVLRVSANQLRLRNGGRISVEAGENAGEAGSLIIRVDQIDIQSQGQISASNLTGTSRGIEIQDFEALSLQSGGQITASTETGNAGSIRIVAPSGQIVLAGDDSLIAARATGLGGIAGNVEIQSWQLLVEDGAIISVSSEEGQAGNLDISSETISLNSGQLSAVTGVSSPGADILLSDVLLLRMSDNSLISAQALVDASGGNINIDASQGYIIGTLNENNDIRADANQGAGGRIEIRALGLYNFEERDAIPENRTNDIDASSEFGPPGTVTINDPTIDPSRARTELPESVLDARDLIASSCEADLGEGGNSFVVTGRGGLPLSPEEIVRSDNAGLVDLGSEAAIAADAADTTTTRLPEATTESPIVLVEAQTWYRDADGTAILAAPIPETGPNVLLLVPTECDRP
jgi:filamentous hemagglutinin family protein